MLARCTRTFLDIESGSMREVGEEFETTPERLSAINSTRYGQLAEEVAEKPADEPTAPHRDADEAPKRTQRGRRGTRTKTEE